MNRLSWTATVAGAAVLAAGIFVYSGVFNVAADSPHWEVASRVIELVRDRSIAVRTDGQTVPDLKDRDLIATGAEHYAEMCTDCHLAPGMTNSALRQGLYPVPPDLTAARSLQPAETFWIIKHGIKMSAMPARGHTHDDETIWAIVACLQQLPTLDTEQYAALTGAPNARDHGHDTGHHDPQHGAYPHDTPAGGAVTDPGRATMDQASAADHVHKH